MTATFKSKGALAGERLCPRRWSRPVAAGPIRYFISQTLTSAAGISAGAAHVRWAAVVVRGKALFSTARLSMGASVSVIANSWWRKRATGPLERAAHLSAEYRAAAAGAESRTITERYEDRRIVHSYEQRVFVVPPEPFLMAEVA